MLGKLPCLSTDEECVGKLQALAVQNNATLKAVDQRIEAVDAQIAAATASNKKAINASLITPLLQSWLQIQVQPTGQRTGILNKLAGLFSSPLGTVNEIFSLLVSRYLIGQAAGIMHHSNAPSRSPISK